MSGDVTLSRCVFRASSAAEVFNCNSWHFGTSMNMMDIISCEISTSLTSTDLHLLHKVHTGLRHGIQSWRSKKMFCLYSGLILDSQSLE